MPQHVSRPFQTRRALLRSLAPRYQQVSPTQKTLLRTQRKPRLHGLSATTPAPRRLPQTPVLVFSLWEKNRPGFVEVDLVAHCGAYLDGSFLYTMTLTDLATGWTECLPLQSKRADSVRAALVHARTLFPFPLLGIDTDSGSEFLNEEVIAYCERERLTFTHGRPGIKNDQCHVEQKNGSVVRETVGCVRLMEVQAFRQLGEVYQALRLVVNYVQPSFKLQAKVPVGDRVRRVYDAAQTPLQRLLASGILPEDQQRALREQVQQLDPLLLSELLDTLRHTLLRSAQGLDAIDSEPRSVWEDPWPSERLQENDAEPHPEAQRTSSQAPDTDDSSSTQASPLSTGTPGIPNNAGEHEADRLALTTVEQAIEAYIQDMRACGRDPKTVQWHRTSLGALRRYLRRRFHLTKVEDLTTACLQTWVCDLPFALSVRTGTMRTVSTVAAYARSARAFCNWLVRQGYVSESLFPEGAVPHAQRNVPQPVEPETFARLLGACCQLPGDLRGPHVGMTTRNRAILWLLLDTGLSVSDVCRLRLADVDCVRGMVTVQGKRGCARLFPLSADGKRAVLAYLEQARPTPVWEPAVPEAQDQLLFTERRYPLTKNSLTLLFARLNQRAALTTKPICPSMLRDTYAIRFLQAGGDLHALQEQLGLADRASVQRYQRFCDEQRRAEPGAQASSEHAMPPRSVRQSKGKRRKARRRG